MSKDRFVAVLGRKRTDGGDTQTHIVCGTPAEAEAECVKFGGGGYSRVYIVHEPVADWPR